MIAAKTLKLSLKSLRDFAKKKLPDETLIRRDGRWRLRYLPGVRRNGAHRPGTGYVGVRYLSGQRSDYGGSDSGAKETMARQDCRRGNSLCLWRYRTGGGERPW